MRDPKTSSEMFCLYIMLAALLLGSVWSVYVTASSFLFYLVLAATALVAGVVVMRRPPKEGFLVLLLFGLVRELIVPLSKPGAIIDNYPDAFDVRLAVLSVAKTGFLPLATSTSNFFALYPGTNLLLYSVHLVSGMSIDFLIKYISILIFVPMLGAVPLMVRGFGVKSERAQVVATAIVVMIPFVSETANTSPHSFGTVLLVMALAFLGASMGVNSTQFSMCFVLMALAVAIYHVTSSLFMIALGLTLTLALRIPAVRRRTPIRHGPEMIVLVLLVFVGFFMIGSPNVPAALIGLLIAILSIKATVTVTYLAPTGLKTLWMLIIQYLAFGLFGVAVLGSLLSKVKAFFLSKIFGSLSIILAMLFGGIWLLGFNLSEDLFGRSFLLLMVGTGPLVGANLDRISERASRGRINLGATLGIFVIALLLVNSVLYAYPPFYYDNSVPLESEDTRHYLQEWQSLGNFVLSYSEPGQVIWGPRLGYSLVGLYSNVTYYEFSPGGISASSFPYLPWLLQGEYIVISRAMSIAPDYAGYYPNISAVTRISTRVYDNGQDIMLIAFAPTGLMPTPNPSSTSTPMANTGVSSMGELRVSTSAPIRPNLWSPHLH